MFYEYIYFSGFTEHIFHSKYAHILRHHNIGNVKNMSRYPYPKLFSRVLSFAFLLMKIIGKVLFLYMLEFHIIKGKSFIKGSKF